MGCPAVPWALRNAGRRATFHLTLRVQILSYGNSPLDLPGPASARCPSISLQWESTIFLPEAVGGHGTWGSCPGSDSQVAIASSFSAPLRICISDSLGCYRGPWSFSPGLGLWSQPSCLPDLTVQPRTTHKHRNCSSEQNGTCSLCLSGVTLNHKVTLIPIKPLSIPGPHRDGPTRDLDSRRWSQLAAWQGDSGSPS